jgi:hypothetical protein
MWHFSACKLATNEHRAIVAIVIAATRHPPDAVSQASEDQHHPYEPDHQFVRRLGCRVSALDLSPFPTHVSENTPARDEFRVIMGAHAIQATEGCDLSHSRFNSKNRCTLRCTTRPNRGHFAPI